MVCDCNWAMCGIDWHGWLGFYSTLAGRKYSETESGVPSGFGSAACSAVEQSDRIRLNLAVAMGVPTMSGARLQWGAVRHVIACMAVVLSIICTDFQLLSWSLAALLLPLLFLLLLVESRRVGRHV